MCLTCESRYVAVRWTNAKHTAIMHRMPSDPLAQYADSVFVVVRHTEEIKTPDPDFTTATVARMAVGGDVPVEDMREEILGWLLRDAKVRGDNEYEVRRRHIQVGASGAEAAIILSLLGGALGGVAGSLTEQAVTFIRTRLAERTDHLEPLDDQLADLDGMRHAVARAFEIRTSDLRLVESRTREEQQAAVFEDAAGRAYGVRRGRAGLTIRRLRRDEY